MKNSTIAKFAAGAAVAVAVLAAPGVVTAQTPLDDDLLDLDTSMAIGDDELVAVGDGADAPAVADVQLDVALAPAEVGGAVTIGDTATPIAGADAPVDVTAGTTVGDASVSATPTVRTTPTVDAGPIGASAPVTVCGNSIGVLADASSSCAPSSPAQLDGANALNVVAPVTVCGNSVSVLADASGSCTTAATPAPTGSAAAVFLSAAVCGGQVSVLSDGASSCIEAASTTPPAVVAGPAIDPASDASAGTTGVVVSAAGSDAAASNAARSGLASAAGERLPLPMTGATILALVLVAVITLGTGGATRLLVSHPTPR